MPTDLPQNQNATPEGGHERFTPFLPNFTPRTMHEPEICPCYHCTWLRLPWRMDATTPPPQFTTEKDIAQGLHRQRPDAKAERTPVTVSPFPDQDTAYPEVYVYPSASHHITFPVVDYTTKRRSHGTSAWPACYLAISPQCAKPADFEAVLSPPGSGTIMAARLLHTKKTMPLSAFKDAEELRKSSIQLEVWDERVTKVSILYAHTGGTVKGPKEKKKGSGKN
ncbi:hypothetical protein F4805DRAFT_475839 [Annulohypoxylon moriforme]|nr:hypothetical protein F4805DRAFT_475839 [Annulohypoxylon moriforme]